MDFYLWGVSSGFYLGGGGCSLMLMSGRYILCGGSGEW